MPMTQEQLELYTQIRKARRERGIPVANLNVQLEDHPYAGKKVIKTDTGEVGVVESVQKQWYDGWYIAVLINFDGSHALRTWENIDCRSANVLDIIAENREKLFMPESTDVALNEIKTNN